MKKRNAFDAFRCVGRARENEVHDVLAHVVLAPRDEYLRPAQPVVVAFANGLRANSRQIGTGLRLGQVHRPAPFARSELRHEQRLLLGRSVMAERFEHTGSQHRRKTERHVRAVPDLLDCRGNAVR